MLLRKSLKKKVMAPQVNGNYFKIRMVKVIIRHRSAVDQVVSQSNWMGLPMALSLKNRNKNLLKIKVSKK